MVDETKISTQEFISQFDNLYDKNKVLIFTAFDNPNYFSLTEQKQIFDKLSVKQQCQLYNTISLEARQNYCDYLQTLPECCIGNSQN